MKQPSKHNADYYSANDGWRICGRIFKSVITSNDRCDHNYKYKQLYDALTKEFHFKMGESALMLEGRSELDAMYERPYAVMIKV